MDGRGGSFRCFSSTSPVLGFLCRNMKCTFTNRLEMISTCQTFPHFGSRTRQIRAKHDDPRCGVGKLFAARLKSILQKFEVTTTAIATLLVLDFVLNNKRSSLEVYGLRKGSRDSVVCSFAFGNETFVAVNERDRRLFDLPFADIAESLATNWGLLGCLRRRPTV